MKYLFFFLIAFSALGCQKRAGEFLNDEDPPYVAVMARSEILVRVLPGSGREFIDERDNQSDVNITVTNQAVSTMTVKPFTNPPPVTPGPNTTLVDLGPLEIGSLFDNNLRQCPSNPASKCSKAGFRLSTATVDGLVNMADPNEILPILGLPVGGTLTKLLKTPPLVVQMYNIPLLKFNLRLSDFTPAPSYDLQIDLTNAGAGSFTGTVVVEYFLAP